MRFDDTVFGSDVPLLNPEKLRFTQFKGSNGERIYAVKHVDYSHERYGHYLIKSMDKQDVLDKANAIAKLWEETYGEAEEDELDT